MANPIGQAKLISDFRYSRFVGVFWTIVLGSVGFVMHEEHVDIRGVLNEKSLMAARHHVTGLLIGTISDL